ncbi:armadillo-type protein [Panaeolus papilionaceus]|nr:armadillo-type protein [Panaeolus papilionaceus]
MQSILRWSIENSTPLDGNPTDRPQIDASKLNPEIIDLILGKPDAQQIKEDMEVAVDTNKSEDDRINALDHLEMLIEHIDNANDLEKLGLWEPLQALLTAESSTPEIKKQTLWVIGTALQNNFKAQDVYLSKKPLSTLVSFLQPGPNSSPELRAKAIYTISGLLKHNGPAVEALDEDGVHGWKFLRDALQDPSIAVRRKTTFLLGALLIPTGNEEPEPVPPTHLLTANPNPTPSTQTGIAIHPSDPIQSASAPVIHDNSHASALKDPSRSITARPALAAFKKHGIIDAIISSIVNPVPYGEDGENTEADRDYEEKTLRLLHTYAVTCKGELSKSEKETLRSWIQAEKQKAGGEKQLLERWEFTRGEYASLIGKLI